MSVLVGRIVQGFEATLDKASNSSCMPVTTLLGSDGIMAEILGGYASSSSSPTASLPRARTAGGASPSSIGSMSSRVGLFPEAAATTTGTRLAWGVLQVEYDDDVDELKQHLWLVHFRKLEALLRLFGAAVRRMRDGFAIGFGAGRVGDAARPAQILACEGVDRWLDQKVRAVRDRFESQEATAPGDGRH